MSTLKHLRRYNFCSVSSVLVLLPVLLLLVSQAPPVTASCSCTFEYDWLFDIDLSQTLVTLTVTLHTPMSIFGPLNFNPVARYSGFTAHDASNSSLQTSIDDTSSGRQVAVLLGGQKGEGYTFSITFLDSSLASQKGPDTFTALWTWSVNNGVVLNTFRLWLPQGYVISSLTGSSKTYTTAVLQGRIYATALYLAAVNEQFYWYLEASRGTITITNTITNTPSLITRTTGSSSAIETQSTTATGLVMRFGNVELIGIGAIVAVAASFLLY